MAGPWLYVISERAHATFDFNDGPVPVTVDNFRKLVENGRLVEDRYWGGNSGIRRNHTKVEADDELFIYSSDKDSGIIGYAKIIGKEKRGNGWYLLPQFNLEKCLALLQHPVPVQEVKAWNLHLRNNVINLAPIEERLQELLPKQFSAPLPIHVEDQELIEGEIDQLL